MDFLVQLLVGLLVSCVLLGGVLFCRFGIGDIWVVDIMITMCVGNDVDIFNSSRSHL